MERQVCYNVQCAVDTKHHLIVAHDIVMTTDRGQLTLVAEQVQETLDKKDITIIADKGYFSRIDIKATQDLGMTVNIPQIDSSGAVKKAYSTNRHSNTTQKKTCICALRARHYLINVT